MVKKSSAKAAGSAKESAVSIGLSRLAPATGSRHRRKRVGFGEGSGSGKTCGRGGKGQTARSGGRIPRGFEGGQMPLHRRLPKVGFTSRMRVKGKNIYTVISAGKLGHREQSGVVTLAILREKGLLSKNGRVKILGGGTVDKKITVEAHAVSACAKDLIEKAGGTITLV